jgi:hypothetical protein
VTDDEIAAADWQLLEQCELDVSDTNRPTGLCQHCGLRYALWDLDHDGCCIDCHDPDEQLQRNQAGFDAAHAALQAARVRRGNPVDPDPSNLWAVHRDDDVGAGDG